MNNLKMNTGKLIIYIGSMFSGKTSAMLNQIDKFNIIDKPYLLIGHIQTHKNNKCITHKNSTCNSTCNKNITKNFVTTNLLSNVQIPYNTNIICIDEGQFFDDLFSTVNNWVEQQNYHVIVSGLIADYAKQPFNQMLNLLLIADNIYHYTALCCECKDGTAGIFSTRLSDDKDKLVPFNGNNYTSTCRYHYNLLNKKN